jgi:hypothetical protein
MPWRRSGESVSVQIRTYGSPDAYSTVLQWPVCVGRKRGSSPQIELATFGRERIEARVGIFIEDLSYFELLDELAAMAIEKRLDREESLRRQYEAGELTEQYIRGMACLDQFVEFDELGDVVVWRSTVDCDPVAYSKMLQEFTSALAREMYIDYMRRAAIELTDHGMDYTTADNLRDEEEEALFYEMAQVLTDLVMELDVLSAETLTDMCDLELSVVQLARMLVWRMLGTDEPADYRGSSPWLTDGWTHEYIEWFKSLDLPTMEFEQDVLERIMDRLDREWLIF